jgi:hypothetical protein
MSYVIDIGTRLLLWAVGKFRRPKFGKFLKLEDIKYKIFQAAKRKEETFPDLVVSYISAAFLIPSSIIEKFSWEVTFSLFLLGVTKSVPNADLPLLKPSKKKDEKAEWDYEGRMKYLNVHIISSAYGWTIEYVNKLDIDTALALIQEILTDEQLDREFLWSMSENSYIYNPKTKSGKANPLERPYFMMTQVKDPKVEKIPAGMLPAGVDYSSIPEAFRPRVKHEETNTENQTKTTGL